MITITIQGHGTFTIHQNKLNELLTWLQSNAAVPMEGVNKIPNGQTLLNENRQG